MFTTSVFIVKQIGVDLLEASIPRFLSNAIFLIIYMKCIKRDSLFQDKTKEELFYLSINAFFYSTGFLSFFLAYKFIPLSDLTTIRYTQLIWTAIITAIIYREKPSIAILIGVPLTILGVILITQPNFFFEKTLNNVTKNSINYHHRIIGSLIALYSSLATCLTVISNKYLYQKYKTKNNLVLLNFTWATIFILILYEIYKYYLVVNRIEVLKTNFISWKYLLASIIYSIQIISTILSQKAIKREHPSIYSICRSSEILFSILLQNIFTSVKSNILSLLGSILVLLSILIISGYKYFTDKKSKNKP